MSSRHRMIKAAAEELERDGSKITAKNVTREMQDLFSHSPNIPNTQETGQMMRRCGYYPVGLVRDKSPSRGLIQVYERRK